MKLTILSNRNLELQENIHLKRSEYYHPFKLVYKFCMTFTKRLILTIKNKLYEREFIFTGLLLIVTYWLLESFLMANFFKESNFYSQIFNPNAHEIWMRILVILIIFFSSMIIQPIFNKRRRTENKLLMISNDLERLIEQRTEELKKANDLLHQRINQNTHFMRAIVHELKTPLTPMIGTSEILMEKTKKDATLLRLASNIHRGSNKLNRRISDLTDLAKGETGLLKIEYQPFDLLIAINELLDYIQINAEKKHQSLILEAPSQFPIVWADENRIRQVILNLLDNAIKFTADYGKIIVKIKATNINFNIQITDSGCGIDEEEMKYLFEYYWRSDKDQESCSGLGIGLPLSKMIIELHGGKIWAKSKKGVGSTFSFSIPMIIPKLSNNNY